MTLQKIFGTGLYKTAILSWIKKLINIPKSVLIAYLTASVVSLATEGNTPKLLITGLGVLVIIVFTQLFIYLSDIAFKKMEAQVMHKSKMRLFKFILSSPLSQLYQSEYGELQQVVDKDLTVAINKHISLYPEVFTGVIAVIAYSVLIGLQSPLLLSVMMVFAVLQVVPPIIVKKKLQVNYDECRIIEAKDSDYILSGFQGFELIKLYGLKSWWQKGFAAVHKDELRIGSKAESTNTVESILYHLVDAALKYGTYIVVGLFALYEIIPMTVGVQAIALSADFYSSVKTICSKISGFSVAKRAEKHLLSWTEYTPTANLSTVNGHITFSDVSYRYENNEVLSDFSLEFDSSKITLVKGANGSGKSTLLRLIVGLIECQEGSVCVGDSLSSQLADKLFPGTIFYLPQDDPMFDFSAKELYSMLFSYDCAKKIALQFSLSDEILCNKKIRELSGGERKKAFLSLAFAINPMILLLDEPTNSLDEHGKKILKQLLEERSGGAIIITHDTSLDNVPNIQQYHLGGEPNEAIRCR